VSTTTPNAAGAARPAPGPRDSSARRPFGLVRDGIHDITSRLRLIRFLVAAEMKRTHADTTIGKVWWVLDPILSMVVYWMLVAVIFKRPTPDILLFLMCAILPWKWFSATLTEASTSITSRQGLVRQLQFPKIVLPTAAAGAAMVSFLFGLIALLGLYLLYPHRLTAWVLAVPLVAVVQFVFSLSLAIFLAAMNTFFRDVQNVLRHVVRLWMYLSPVLYSLGQLEDQPMFKLVLGVNPMSWILEGYRNIFYGPEIVGGHGIAPDVLPLLGVLGISLVLLAVSISIFKRAEPAFARILA
jgi:lipopolysaccharide transport system permease protein